MKRMACVLALTSGVGMGAGLGANRALAETIVTPAPSGLALTVSTAASVTSDAPLSLDVRFEGGTLRVVELSIDGVTIKKKTLATRNSKGHLEFQMEAGLLSEGTHDILIKAQDADGSTATATTQIKVTPGASGLVKFQFPKNKAMVQGVLPIEIKLDASIRNPYVSFFIDDNFLSLTNYAPFTVNWDSAHVANGEHTIGVEVYDGDTLAKVKATSLHITVNNPGGLTTRQNTTPDLSKPAANPVRTVEEGIQGALDASRHSAAPQSGLKFHAPDELVARTLNSQPASLLRSPETRDFKTSGPAAPGNRDRNPVVEPTAHVSPASPAMLGALVTPGEFAALRAPAAMTTRLAPSTFRPRRAGSMAARPSLQMESDRAIAAASTEHGPAIVAHPIAPVVVKLAAKPVPIKIARSMPALRGPGAITGKGRTIQVAFDNTRIAFDVQPRVEHGLPVAPFRQIFEHTGGTIQWYNQSKTLRAFSSTREIEFKVGADEAKVNNQTVKLDTKTFIEKGRTIVPLSFVRDALDVNITYDAKTGHLRIDSKK